MEIGDLVKLKPFWDSGQTLHKNLIGIVVDKGTEERRMYGDGFLVQEYVAVKWLGDDGKYKKVSRYTPARDLLEVISEA